MTNKEQKSFLRRITNIKVLVQYLRESLTVVRQGDTWKDKFILLIHFFKIPYFIFISLLKNKLLIDIEEKNKFLAGNVVIKNKFGKYFCGNNILTVYVASEYYESNLLPYFEIQDGVFIDVGAHIGKYTIMTGTQLGARGKVIAIEPEENNFNSLNKNIVLNKLENVIPINRGAYSSAGDIPFFVTDAGGGEHSAVHENPAWKKTTIATDTLDNMFENLNLASPVKLIKIDAEGSEVYVLEGAKNIITKFHPKIIIEVLKENTVNLNAVKQIMSGYSYQSTIQIDDDNYFFS